MSEPPTDAAGHRARLRTRLIEGGPNALQDIALTRQIIETGAPLNIAVHDHVIICTRGYASLRALVDLRA